jgi:hypothetical protein
MNSVGEDGNQSFVAAPVSIVDAPLAIPGDASAAETRVNKEEENVLNALKAAQTDSSPGDIKAAVDNVVPAAEVSPKPEDLPKSQVADYLARFGDKPNREELKINLPLPLETPTLTDLNQPQAKASMDAASPNPVTLNDLLTKGPPAAFNEPVPAVLAAATKTIPQPGDIKAAVDNAVPATEVSPKPEDPQAVFIQDVRDAFAKLDKVKASVA